MARQQSQVSSVQSTPSRSGTAMTWRSFDARSPSLVFGTELPARVEESAVNARKPPASPRSSKNLLDEQRSAIDRPRPPKGTSAAIGRRSRRRCNSRLRRGSTGSAKRAKWRRSAPSLGEISPIRCCARRRGEQSRPNARHQEPVHLGRQSIYDRRGREPDPYDRDPRDPSGRLHRRPDEVEHDLRRRKPPEVGTARRARRGEKARFGR